MRGSLVVPTSVAVVLSAFALGIATAESIKAFKSLNFGDSVSVVCSKIAADNAFTPRTSDKCGSVQATYSVATPPPYGTFPAPGIASLTPFYDIDVLGKPMYTAFTFVQGQLSDVALRLDHNLTDPGAATALFQDYVEVVSRSSTVQPRESSIDVPGRIKTDAYTWSTPQKTTEVLLRTYQGDYWIDIIITDPTLSKEERQLIDAARTHAIEAEQMSKSNQLLQQQQSIDKAAKDF